jgi:hypothetical protein
MVEAKKVFDLAVAMPAHAHGTYDDTPHASCGRHVVVIGDDGTM